MATAQFSSPTELSGISYYVRPLEKGTIDPARLSTSTTRAATVISSARGDVCTSDILDLVTEFLSTDDVYSLDFLSTIVIQTPSGISNKCPIDEGTCQGLSHNIECEIIYATASSLETLLPSGPYFLSSNGIYEAWRLYPDYLDSFEITVIPGAELATYENHLAAFRYRLELTIVMRFSVLTTLERNGIWKNVAVPSRLYTKSSAEKPLAGTRISVKGNFKLAGIKTTMTNRCYTQLYSVEIENADFVEKLMELGAIIVGKTWMCSFASGEEPTDQWIDFHCPFNPRGDTYQSPGGSSSGAGTSLAGYPWLDYSIGTDSES